MNKKGFTLIELLAIIVILAVIALISTPIITDTIANVRKNADKQSATNYIDTIETKLTEAAMEYPDIRYSATLVADTDAGVRVWGCTHCTGDGTSNTAGTIAIDFSGTAPQKVNLAYDRSTGKLSGKVKYVNGCWQINATTSNLTDISTSDTAFCGTDF